VRKAWVPLAILGVALGVAASIWVLLGPPGVKVRVGDVAPDFSLPHHNQPAARGTLRELRGSPVVLVRFDSRWEGSPGYLEELEKIHRRFLREGLVVVGVALDPEAEQRALDFVLANRGISFSVLLDPEGRVTDPLYGPTRDKAITYLLDSSGRLLEFRHDLPRWSGPDLRERLLGLLPTPTPTPLDTPHAGR
jgi:peroxiredoxin